MAFDCEQVQNFNQKPQKTMIYLLIIAIGTALIHGFAIVHTLKTEAK